MLYDILTINKYYLIAGPKTTTYRYKYVTYFLKYLHVFCVYCFLSLSNFENFINENKVEE